MLEFTVDVIDAGACSRRMNHAKAGALANFEGRVRDNHLGRQVKALEYEAAPVLAQREFVQIVDVVKKDLPIIEVLCVHRIGHLDVGETAIWLGVLAPHRAEAFAACEQIMSDLKKRLPIWKKEFFVDGSETWVDDPCSCVHVDSRTESF